MLSVDLAIGIVRCFQLDPFPARLASAPTVVRTAAFFPVVLDTIHTLSTLTEVIVASETRPSPRASTRTLVMPRQCVASGELATTLVARMWTFSSMQLGMALEIVQATEPRLAGLTDIWLFLTVSQQVALEVVVSREVRGAVRAFVPLVGCR